MAMLFQPINTGCLNIPGGMLAPSRVFNKPINFLSHFRFRIVDIHPKNIVEIENYFKFKIAPFAMVQKRNSGLDYSNHILRINMEFCI